LLDKINQYTKEIENDLKHLNNYIYDHPEEGHLEYLSSEAHCKLLSSHDFHITKPYMGMETAFKAVFDSGIKGPNIAYLAEYDALPEIGHGCGHNILGTTSTGAGIVLSKLIQKTGGTVTVFGTPAEETSGGKVPMAEGGAFDNIDAVMIVHPAEEYFQSGQSLALEALEFVFIGRTAHAASSPEHGINALNGVLSLFNSVNAMRGHIKQESRIHGIITEGGVAANIVPERAVARFYVRSNTMQYLSFLTEMMKQLAQSAALATSTEVEIRNYELSYNNLMTNKYLNKMFVDNLELFGVEKVMPPKKTYGSVDAGNVSQVCPTIHPYFKISTKPVVAHTRLFASETLTDYALAQMKMTIGALVKTGFELITDPILLNQVKSEFDISRNKVD
jgi:amidohydrolase